jgi:hypothetical protein
MRACATANVAALLAALSVGLVASCTGGSPPAQPPPVATGAPAPLASATPTPPPGPAVTPPASSAASAEKPRKPPETARDCRDLVTEITNEPPEKGVVMNNALTAADAGASDRMKPMIDLIKSKRDGFRCCFDLWTKGHPGESGRVTLRFDLAPDGTLKKAEVKQDESTVHAPELEACMVDLAKSLTYPRSPSGKQTELNYPFDFKARR